jgi:hypothetical protein
LAALLVGFVAPLLYLLLTMLRPWQDGQALGLAKTEIIRCLKRYIAREIYHLLVLRTPAVTALA